LQKGEREFREQLAQTESMVNEELNQLKSTVQRFGEFARLPQVEATEQNVADVLAHHLKTLSATIEGADFNFHAEATDARAKLDSVLLRQVLANIVRNGIEANPGRRVRFDIGMAADGGRIRLTLANDGVPVPVDFAPRIFDPYVSSKAGKNNMGLGLAIVKKIVIEHGGEIDYLEAAGRPSFVITLPRVV
jgi:nitrogen fixation/metabolism regulation signal transduction histidine kinase